MNLIKIASLWTVFLYVWCMGCTQQAAEGIHLPVRQYQSVDTDSLPHQQWVYVPVYSEVYHMQDDQYFLLSASLSVRNTSFKDSLYVHTVDYYDSEGKRLKKYLQKTILIKPLQTVEFVVRQTDKGGSGANFMVHWGSYKPNQKPVIQAVMIGTAYQQGISFVTDGIPADAP